MIAISSDPKIRAAIKRAHAERGDTVRDTWAWLFGGKISR